VRTRSVHVCLDTHELCVSVRQRCFQGAPTELAARSVKNAANAPEYTFMLLMLKRGSPATVTSKQKICSIIKFKYNKKKE
jgi:hypothetical protein